MFTYQRRMSLKSTWLLSISVCSDVVTMKWREMTFRGTMIQSLLGCYGGDLYSKKIEVLWTIFDVL